MVRTENDLGSCGHSPGAAEFFNLVLTRPFRWSL